MTLQDSLLSDIPKLSPDEQEFMRDILDRVLVVGRARYAPWSADADDRDLEREAYEEVLDVPIYLAMLRVRKRRQRTERLRCFIHDEAFAKVSTGLSEIAQATFDVSEGAVNEVLK